MDKDDPADVARAGFDAMMRGDERVVPGSCQTKLTQVICAVAARWREGSPSGDRHQARLGIRLSAVARRHRHEHGAQHPRDVAALSVGRLLRPRDSTGHGKSFQRLDRGECKIR
jgi:hypothetical protein